MTSTCRKPGLAALQRLVFRSGQLRLQVPQIAHPMPTQTPIQPRERHLRVRELPHLRQQVVNRHQQPSGQPLPPPASGSAWFAAGAVCGCDQARCRGASTCGPSARSCQSVLQGPTQAHRCPGSPPAIRASSWPGCEDGSASGTTFRMFPRPEFAIKMQSDEGPCDPPQWNSYVYCVIARLITMLAMLAITLVTTVASTHAACMGMGPGPEHMPMPLK